MSDFKGFVEVHLNVKVEDEKTSNAVLEIFPIHPETDAHIRYEASK